MIRLRTLAIALLVALHALNARAADPVEIVREVPAGLPSVRVIKALTTGPKHHFVGYYGVSPWSPDGGLIAYLETTVATRRVEANDEASVCIVEAATGRTTGFRHSNSVWNHQQGVMLHWLPTGQLAFNGRVEGRLITIVADMQPLRRRRLLNHPLAALSPDGRQAISYDFDRLRRIRPVTGYAGARDLDRPLVNRPADDGLLLIDVATQKAKLLVSVDVAVRVAAPPASVKDQPFWLEHAAFSRDGARVFFIARAHDPTAGQLVSSPMVISSDGTGLRALLPWAIQGASHFDWLDARRLVLTREHAPGTWHHLLIDVSDPEGAPRKLAPDVLTRDGHCTFSPDRRWMVTDTYPDEHRRQHLFVYDVQTGNAARVASFHAPKEYRGDWRCDLHPRWSRDSRQICIDSAHDGTRQVYVIELDVPSNDP